jgi:hypothetical protein
MAFRWPWQKDQAVKLIEPDPMLTYIVIDCMGNPQEVQAQRYRAGSNGGKTATPWISFQKDGFKQSIASFENYMSFKVKE